MRFKTMLGQTSSVTELLTVICKYAAATQHSKNQQNRITVSADTSTHFCKSGDLQETFSIVAQLVLYRNISEDGAI